MVPNDRLTFAQLAASLFSTKTVSPSYQNPHILFTIYLIGKEISGIGRYRIKEQVGIGEGSMKTLLKRLKEENIIQVEGHNQRGHTLSQGGQKLFHQISQIISFPQEIDNREDKYVIGASAVYSIIHPAHHSDDYVHQTLAMRDEAIKIGGTGCSTLEYNGTEWFFPDTNSYKIQLEVEPQTGIPIERGALMVIGGGDTLTTAILATFAASLLIIEDL